MSLVKMYTTAFCPFCVRAKRILQQKGVEHVDEIRIDVDTVKMKEMLEKTNRRTVPQIFIGDVYVGGCDDLEALDARGGLEPLLQKAV